MIESKVLDESRNIYIQLPTDYYQQNSSKTNYPVIVLLDGSIYLQTTINALDSLADMNKEDLPAPIILAVSSPDREKDFTFSKIETVRPNNTGGGLKFLTFLESELIPYINNRFRISDYRILAGHSLGGLCVMNVYLSENKTFKSHIAIDPSIWWDQAMIEEKIVRSSKNFRDKELFIATAYRDTIDQVKNLDKHRLIAELITNQDKEKTSISHQYYPNETHRSIPAVAIKDGLEMFLLIKSNR